MRMIDADALKKDLSELNYDMALRIVDTQPTIEPEVRHGSECLAAANKELAMKYKGCPFCLARMDGGADNG